MIYNDTMTSELFEKWFSNFLIPSIEEKSVIILDNATFHRMDKLREIAQKFGHIILPLPPYSPELNPIEKVWANLKKFVRNNIHKFASLDDILVAYFAVN